MEKASQWIFSLGIPSDVTVHAAGVPFSLHKLLLVSKSGYLRKLVLESKEAEKSAILLRDIPGGSDGFELAAKFCYGIHFDLTPENAATAHCVAEYLDMSEKYAANNLKQKTNAYLNEVALTSLPAAISLLRNCEQFMSIAEKVKLVGRCIGAIAFLACKERQGVMTEHHVAEWWAEDLTALRVDVFWRVMVAMASRGFESAAYCSILTLYGQKSLCCLDVSGISARKIEPELAQEKRTVIETLTGLLPRNTTAVSASFISLLLKASKLVETTLACRVELERRMGEQLGNACPYDVMIPTYSNDEVMYDAEALQRIVAHHMESELKGGYGYREGVAELLESCILEMATDPKLSVARFVALAKVVPELYKATEDGEYRAVDVYLKAHPDLSDLERRKVCRAMDCRRLSEAACAHAALNERLPVHTAVQVLFYQKQRLQALVSNLMETKNEACLQSTEDLRAAVEAESLRSENEALKLENFQLSLELKRKLQEQVRSPDTHSPSRRKSFVNYVSKRVGWFFPFAPIMPGAIPASNPKPTGRTRVRRHSLS